MNSIRGTLPRRRKFDWLGGPRSALATQPVIGLGGYGKTFTVLTCPSVRDETFEDEEGDDGNLGERWTPRFHRR